MTQIARRPAGWRGAVRVGGILGMLLALPALMAVRTVYRVYVQRNERD